MTDRKFIRLDGAGMHQMKDALRAAGLPTDDIRGNIAAFRLDDVRGPLGWAALEQCGPDALIRSVVIAVDRRGAGAGTDLIRRVVREARELGVERLWILTETATSFFVKLGFGCVDRSEAPSGIRSTSEFAERRCASATCMTMKLAE